MHATKETDAKLRQQLLRRREPPQLRQSLWALDTGFGQHATTRKVDAHGQLHGYAPIIGGLLPHGRSNVEVSRLSSVGQEVHCVVTLAEPLRAQALYPISGLFSRSSHFLHRAERDTEVVCYADCRERDQLLKEFSFSGSPFQVACALRYLHVASQQLGRARETLLPSRSSILGSVALSHAGRASAATLLHVTWKSPFTLPELPVTPDVVVQACDLRDERLADLCSVSPAARTSLARSGVATLDQDLLHLIDPISGGDAGAVVPSAYPSHPLSRVLRPEVRHASFRISDEGEARLLAFLLDRAVSPIVRELRDSAVPGGQTPR